MSQIDPAAMAPPPVKPPGKLAGLWAKFTGIPGALWRLSLPVKAALIVALVQLAIVIWAWTVFWVDPNSVPWRHSLTTSRLLLVLGLLVVIPLLVHRALRLWLEGDTSLFPDLDFAWQAGVDALKQNGLSLESIPVFVIIGSASEQQERALIAAAGLNLRVRGVPEGPAPLHWYANPDAIYLFCSQASWLSGLASAHEAGKARLAAPGQAESSEAALVYAAEPDAAESPVPDRGTLAIDSYVAAQSALTPPTRSREAGRVTERLPALRAISTPAGGDEGAARGTMMLQTPVSGSETAEGRPAAAPASPPASWRAPATGEGTAAILPAQDSADQLQRLQYVAQLLRRARQPLCAINGVLSLVPYELVSSGSSVDELQRAMHGDRLTLQRTLGLRAPSTALVVGLETERGFRELMRRVGRDRSQLQRFGRGFDLRALASAEELTSFSEHLAGAFEDWIYTLFREKDSLSRPGNTRLYGLLCKVRSTVKGRLASVLVGGYGYDPILEPQEDPALFSGCYFAATGETEDRQAFVRAVFDKLLEEQEHIEWTRRAQESERRYQSLALAGGVVDALLAATLLGLIGVHLWRR